MKLNLKLKWSLRTHQSFQSYLLPVRECVKSGDDHERYLGGEEDSNDYNQHQGGALGISLPLAFSNKATTGIEEDEFTVHYCPNRTNLPLLLRDEVFPPPQSDLLEILVFLDLLLISHFLLWSALLKAEQRKMLSITRETQGRRWTKKTRNLKWDTKIFLDVNSNSMNISQTKIELTRRKA